MPSARASREDDNPDDDIPIRNVVDYTPINVLMKRADTIAIRKTFWDNPAYHNRLYAPTKYFLKQIVKPVTKALLEMLNAKELARVLNANVHPKLFSSWLVMSPNATLLAYSGKPDIQQLRDRAALLSQVWREHKDKLKVQDHTAAQTDQYSSSASTIASTVVEGALETLTIENAKSNIIIRAVQPRLLLVLIGGPAPRRPDDFFQITAEARGDLRYPEETTSNGEPASGASSAHDSAHGSDSPRELSDHPQDEAVTGPARPADFQDLSDKEKTRMLSLQRAKIDAATDFMRGDFTSRSFVMPDEAAIP